MSAKTVKCAACRKEKPVGEMKTCMHNQMHRYVCDSKCMNDFYNPPNAAKPDHDAAIADLQSRLDAAEADLAGYIQGAKAEADAGDEARAECRRLRQQLNERNMVLRDTAQWFRDRDIESNLTREMDALLSSAEPCTVGGNGISSSLRQAFAEASAEPVKPSSAFSLGQRVRKVSGSRWQGIIVGTYSTSLTPEGYAVESETEHGSVQIYPAKALELVP